ncbi:MAG: hypothetical protein FJZ16_02455 [Candidatus Omnitrophica bacterium]|nr:hypothetical protein [Candidatus Omnitrophota bacterium]
MRKILHLLGFHGDIRKYIDTGDYEFKFDSPFNLWPTKYECYKCPECGRIDKIPPGNYMDWCFDLELTDLKLKVAKANADIGDYETAIKVLSL